jgi:hypothetical protein
MATKQEYSIGTNAAVPVVQAELDKDIPSMFRSEITLAEVQTIVAEVVTVALDAVDAYRAAQAKGKPK